MHAITSSDLPRPILHVDLSFHTRKTETSRFYTYACFPPIIGIGTSIGRISRTHYRRVGIRIFIQSDHLFFSSIMQYSKSEH